MYIYIYFFSNISTLWLLKGYKYYLSFENARDKNIKQV